MASLVVVHVSEYLPPIEWFARRSGARFQGGVDIAGKAEAGASNPEITAYTLDFKYRKKVVPKGLCVRMFPRCPAKFLKTPCNEIPV